MVSVVPSDLDLFFSKIVAHQLPAVGPIETSAAHAPRNKGVEPRKLDDREQGCVAISPRRLVASHQEPWKFANRIENNRSEIMGYSPEYD